jgi:toxin ParE1/3/4
MQYQLTNRAEEDLRNIGRYTQKEWGRSQRNYYLTMLDDSFRILASAPDRGRACDYLKHGYKKYTAGRHVIFYRQINKDMIEIVRVLHQRKDANSHIS